jgi:hypothetical protein
MPNPFNPPKGILRLDGSDENKKDERVRIPYPCQEALPSAAAAVPGTGSTLGSRVFGPGIAFLVHFLVSLLVRYSVLLGEWEVLFVHPSG